MKAKTAVAGLVLVAAAGGGAAQDVGVSVSISQPGVYGRIDIGSRPPPPVIYAQPVIISRPRVVPQPVYMHVPPGHAKNWGKHCHKYDACGTPVYFVKGDRSDWDHGGRHSDDHGHGHGKGHGKGHGHNKHGH